MCFTVQLSKIGFALPFVSNSFAIISCRFLPVKNFFQLFSKLFYVFDLSAATLVHHITPHRYSCQELFSFLWHPFSRSYGVILPSSLTMLLPSALGFSPHPPVSVYGTGTIRTIAAFLDAWLTYFPTRFRSASRLRIALRFFLQDSYLACTRLSIPRLCSPHVSPQFCLTAVQESQPVVHRLRLSSSP